MSLPPAKNNLDVAPSTENAELKPNISYTRTIPAILKAVEFMLCMFAFSLAASFKNSVTIYAHTTWGRADFFIFVMVASWLGCIVLFLVYFLNIISRLKKIPNLFLVIAAVHFFGALFVLISVALVFDDCIQIRATKVFLLRNTATFCDLIDTATNTTCSVYEGSGVCGFFAFIAIAFDGVLHAMKGVQEYRIKLAESQQQQEVEEGGIETID